jgi:hypothetical protein
MTITCAQPNCDNPVSRNPRGRPALYCSPQCRPSSARSSRVGGRITVEVEHPETCLDGRPPERVWTVQLRRGRTVVVIADALGWPSANALAGELTDMLTGSARHKGGSIE